MGLRPGLRRDFDKFRNDETLRILNNGGFLSSTVLCANDRVAFSAIAAAHHLGVEIGRLAMQLLLRKIGEETEAKTSFPGSERILLNAEIMLRNSA